MIRWSLDDDGYPTFVKVFSMTKYPASQIGAIFVFDDYALIHVDSKLVEVIHFKEHRGKDVPDNYIIRL